MTTLLDKAKIKQSFGGSRHPLRRRRSIAASGRKDLLHFAGSSRLSGTILDLGCGTGFLTGELWRRQPETETVIALDLAYSMLQRTRCKLSPSVPQRESHRRLAYLCADAELLPIADHSLDGLFSNLALQWCNSLEKVLSDFKRILKPGSPLIFSTFGRKTLRELKSAWASVDTYSHVNEFYDLSEVRQLLERAGFTDLKMTGRLHISHYESAHALMKELKQIGAHNVSSGRNRRFTTKAQMQGMIRAYEPYRVDGLIPASFEIIQATARS